MYVRLIAAVLSVVLLAVADDAKDRAKLIRDLAKGGAESIPKISPYLNDSETSVRLEAVKAIVDLDTQRSLDPLVKATADNEPEIRRGRPSYKSVDPSVVPSRDRHPAQDSNSHR